MCAARLPTDGSNAEDALNHTLRDELHASAAMGRAREEKAEEEQVEEAVEVGVGKDLR